MSLTAPPCTWFLLALLRPFYLEGNMSRPTPILGHRFLVFLFHVSAGQWIGNARLTPTTQLPANV